MITKATGAWFWMTCFTLRPIIKHQTPIIWLKLASYASDNAASYHYSDKQFSQASKLHICSTNWQKSRSEFIQGCQNRNMNIQDGPWSPWLTKPSLKMCEVMKISSLLENLLKPVIELVSGPCHQVVLPGWVERSRGNPTGGRKSHREETSVPRADET